jgi:hypothetical protein
LGILTSTTTKNHFANYVKRAWQLGSDPEVEQFYALDGINATLTFKVQKNKLTTHEVLNTYADVMQTNGVLFVPFAQRKEISKARRAGKPVLVIANNRAIEDYLQFESMTFSIHFSLELPQSGDVWDSDQIGHRNFAGALAQVDGGLLMGEYDSIKFYAICVFKGCYDNELKTPFQFRLRGKDETVSAKAICAEDTDTDHAQRYLNTVMTTQLADYIESGDEKRALAHSSGTCNC